MYVTIADIKPNAADVLGTPATIIFMGGCDYKCPYCFVPEYLDEKKCKRLSIDEVVGLIQQIKAQAVYITGGEPTQQGRELKMMCRYFKQMGLKVRVQTNGSNPGVVGELVTANLVDYLGIDVKAPFDDDKAWALITGGKGDAQKVRESVEIAQQQVFEGFLEIVYPVVPGVNDTKAAVTSVAKDVNYCGSFLIRGFDNTKRCVNPEFNKKAPPTEAKLTELADAARDNMVSVDVVRVRALQGEAAL
jgi:pyruvate formate lyase activating enzyme